ncbi:hypothetical protein ACWGVR_19615 [Streptomyces xanthophaeus]
MNNNKSTSWEWIDDIPDGWSAPSEIRKPTASVLTNVVIRMLESGLLGNEMVQLVGELQAESAKYNLWSGTVGKSSLTTEALFRRSVSSRDITRRVYEAWIAYYDEFSEKGRKVGVALLEREALKVALNDARVGLANLQKID